MSLEKAIKHKKEKRKPYKGGKVYRMGVGIGDGVLGVGGIGFTLLVKGL